MSKESFITEFDFAEEFNTIANGKNIAEQVKETKETAGYALEANISSLKSQLHQKERSLKLAQTAVKKSIINNGRPIEFSGEAEYVSGIITSINEVRKLEVEITSEKERIELLQQILDSLK
jgi:hypothetical protein